MGTVAQYRSFDRPVRLLLLNQLTINIGFYMLMPYLAEHLSGQLGLATWTVGLILGVRNFSQQGMFLVGGSLADRLGYKPLIVAGCILRTGGFALLGLVDTVPALLVASAATGFAGALFNPAVRAYLAHDAGERRVEAFALFNVFYQTGILVGPLVGLILTGVTFRLTCLVAAGVFAALSLLQLKALPRCGSQDVEAASPRSVLDDWRSVFANRSFVLFSAAMVGSYVLAFQIYLVLPLETRRIAGSGFGGTAAVTALFVASALVAILGQLSITAWCKRHWSPSRSLTSGLLVMGAAFTVPPLSDLFVGPLAPTVQTAAGVIALVASAALVALGTAIVFPFEMDTIINLSQGRLVATHYGLYNTICGVGILAGNLLTGSVLDLAKAWSLPALPWLALTAIGVACAIGIRALDRSSRLTTAQPDLVVAPR